MVDPSILEDTETLLGHLGLTEEPIGFYYDNILPDGAIGPPKGPEISRELEEQGQLNMHEVFQAFSCVLGNIWRARKKKVAAFISAEEFGCPGGAFYTSMIKPNLKFIENYVTTGIPETPIHGERYLPSPDIMRTFLKRVSPRDAPAKYCIFKPLSLFTEKEEPEFIIFFARPEVISGLFTLTTFTTGDVDCVASPFGAGCTNIVAWPLYYLEKGMEKAVLGGFDPSQRKFMKADELTFTVPFALYRKMLNTIPESIFNVDGAWSTVLKKVHRSARAWGEKE
jgi:uncharacterized protein (DUF169 family)